MLPFPFHAHSRPYAKGGSVLLHDANPYLFYRGGKYIKKSNPIALLPIGVFLVIYLGLGLLFEYGLDINIFPSS